VRLLDGPAGIPARLVRDVPCDQLQVQVESQPSDGEAFGAVVLVFDSMTGQRYAIPIAFHSNNGAACTIPALQCIAPP
jgi:hypothetical protein